MSEGPAPAPVVRKRVPRRAIAAADVAISRGELERLMNQIDLDQALLHLARALSLDTPDLATRPGRLAVFQEAFAAAPGLLKAAAASDSSRIQHEWSAYAATQAGNARFWHALAVLLRERMIHCRATWSGRQWESLSALWIWLMCTDAFWEYFAAPPQPAKEGEPQEKLSSDEARELHEWAVSDWLAFHRAEGARALSSGAIDEASTHLRCLKMAESGEEALRKGLGKGGWTLSAALHSEKIEFARRAARELLAQWEEAALAEAERMLQAAEQQSSSTFKNAIAMLERYALVAGDSRGILVRILEWYIKWAEADKHSAKDIPRVSESARQVVEKLASMAKPGDSLARENVLLATYYTYCGLAEERPGSRIELADKALKWNPNEINAQAMHLYGRLNMQSSGSAMWRIVEECRGRRFDPELLQDVERKLRDLGA